MTSGVRVRRCGPTQLEREGVVRQVAQQGIEPVAAEPGIVEGQAIAFQDVREQPQAVGAGEAVELVPPGAGQAGVARTAGDEQAALAFAGGEVAEQLGEAAAFVVGVGVGDGAARRRTAAGRSRSCPRP